ncbi:MAG: GldG family protein [Oceanipulchritudo sp.]
MIKMSKWESYQFANRLKFLNNCLQVLLIFSLIFGLNYLAMHQFHRFDLTENHRYALSPETRAYIQELPGPIRIIVTIPGDSPRQEEQVLYRYVSQLLQEYVYQSRRSGRFLIEVEYVDIYKDLVRADFLARTHGLDQPDSLLVLSGERQRLIRADELLSFANLRPVTFNGESTLTSAIMEVTQEQSPKIYFLQGHQEVEPSDPSPQFGLSHVTRELQLRNFTIARLDLTSIPEVPGDASALVIADPKGPLLTSELDKIRSYLSDRAGRVLIWVRPGVETGLHPLIAEWGIRLSDQVVIEPDPGFREAKGTLLVRNFGEHPITESLIENKTFLLSGWVRPVFPVPPQPADERLSFIPLFATSPESWAESSYQTGAVPSFDPGADFKGPVPIAIAAERKASSQLGIRVPGGRIVVFGSADLFANQNIASLGNVNLFFNTLNWMLDRDRFLIIPPRPVDSYKLALSRDQLQQLGLLFLIVPGSVAVMGLLVHWIRIS